MDEFERFEAKAFVGRLLGRGDWKGFVNKIQVGLGQAMEQQYRIDALARGVMCCACVMVTRPFCV